MNDRPNPTSIPPVLASLLLAAFGCGAGGAVGPERVASDVGVVQLELTAAPVDASCLRVTATVGSKSVDRMVDVGSGARTVALVDGLPVGSGTVSAVAFSETCAQVMSTVPPDQVVPSWFASAVKVTISTTSTAAVTLTFTRGGKVAVSADFSKDTPVVEDVALGGYVGAALLRDGTVWTWGEKRGPLRQSEHSRPEVVSRGGGFSRLSGSPFQGLLLGLRTDGTVFDFMTSKTKPDLYGVTHLAGGNLHHCAVSWGGTVLCWGDNEFGQLGTGAKGDRDLLDPDPVTVRDLSGVVETALGQGFSVALRSDGLVYAWGDNALGQLGDGTTTESLVPTRVDGLTNVVQISAGADHACARIADGTVRCWGNNRWGQLGDGTETTRLRPQTVPGLTNATSLALGPYASFVSLADGTGRSWGDNDCGQLGDGTMTRRQSPVTVSGLSSIARVVANGSLEDRDFHGTACAILTDGGLRCWGDNTVGRTGGDFQSECRPTPVAVKF